LVCGRRNTASSFFPHLLRPSSRLRRRRRRRRRRRKGATCRRGRRPPRPDDRNRSGRSHPERVMTSSSPRATIDRSILVCDPRSLSEQEEP
jgi:hypothetical protein